MSKPKTVILIKSARTKKPVELVRNITLHTKVTFEEAATISAEASLVHKTTSTYIRDKVLGIQSN